MYITRALDAYLKNPTSNNLLYKAVLSLEFKREENEAEVVTTLEQLKSIALKNQFNNKDWAAKVKSASNYVYDQNLREFARSNRKTR